MMLASRRCVAEAGQVDEEEGRRNQGGGGEAARAFRDIYETMSFSMKCLSQFYQDLLHFFNSVNGEEVPCR